jgi:hypothetical protein
MAMGILIFRVTMASMEARISFALGSGLRAGSVWTSLALAADSGGEAEGKGASSPHEVPRYDARAAIVR